MVKKISLLLFVILVVSVFAIPKTVFSADESSKEGPVIVTLSGLVSVKLPGESWKPAKTNMLLDKDATIKTALGSYCDVSLDGSLDNIVSIGPESEAIIGEYMQKISVSNGRVFARLEGLQSDSYFRVETPTAIAGVRGTQWESQVGVTAKFSVNKGEVNVSGIDEQGNITGQVYVPAGKYVSVGGDGWLGELTDLTEEDVERLNEWSQSTFNRATKQRECDDLISRYQGASANLFAEVLSCDAGRSTDTFASTDGFEPPSRNDIPTGNNTPSEDITPRTFDDPQPEPPETEEKTICNSPMCRDRS